MSFLFFGGVMKRFITYLDDLAKRTYFGTDGTEPQRSGVLGYRLEGLLGFFGLVILPAMAAATLYHWIFD